MYDNFQPNNIKQQYEAYKNDNGVDQAKGDAVSNELGKIDAKDGKCESIAKGFIQVNNANKGVLEKIYLVDGSVRDAIYKKNPVNLICEIKLQPFYTFHYYLQQIKPKGISIFRFCAKQFYQDGEAAYCNVRRHGFSDDPKFIKHSNCTTRGMRWMKKNGEMDVRVDFTRPRRSKIYNIIIFRNLQSYEAYMR